MWYMAPTKHRRTGREWSMDEIRTKYGSKTVTEGAEDTKQLLLMA